MNERMFAFLDKRLPESVLRQAYEWDEEQVLGLRNSTGVHTETINGVEYILCDGYCSAHADWEEISILWVIRNDTQSWVWSNNKKMGESQPSRSVIIIDIGKKHGLNCRNGKKGRSGIWLAALVAKLDKWPSDDDVKAYLKEFIENPRTLTESCI